MGRHIAIIAGFMALVFVFDWAFFDENNRFVGSRSVSKSEPVKEQPKLYQIDCAEAPDAAVTPSELSDEIAAIGRIDCLSAGHWFGANLGELWLYLVKAHHDLIYPVQVSLVADQRALTGKGVELPFHSAHFVSIESELLEGDDVVEFLNKIPEYFGALYYSVALDELESVSKIVAINHDGVAQQLYVAKMKEMVLSIDGREFDRFGYACNPECEPLKFFRIMDYAQLETPTVMPE